MAELKTRPSDRDVRAFLSALEDEQQREDAFALLNLMQEITGQPPRLWGENIIGFGEYHYRYASGRQGDWPTVAFAPRKRELVLYIMSGFEAYPALMQRLGKYRTGKSCLYVRRLKEIDLPTLRELIRKSVEDIQAHYP